MRRDEIEPGIVAAIGLALLLQQHEAGGRFGKISYIEREAGAEPSGTEDRDAEMLIRDIFEAPWLNARQL